MVFEGSFSISRKQADELYAVLIRCVITEYPNKPNHVLHSPEDLRPPRELHPAFYGCFDWHSAVHSHWSLARLLNLDLLDRRDEALKLLSAHLSKDNLLAERAFFESDAGSVFERTYGWAWLLALYAELATARQSEIRSLATNIEPLEQLLRGRMAGYLATLRQPDRTGLHNNTAYALSLVRDYATKTGQEDFKKRSDDVSRSLFSADAGCSMAGEPGLADFLSPCLVEADLMRKVLPSAEFEAWFAAFLPEFKPESIHPVGDFDRSDLYAVHLDGLNLSRAWCLFGTASALGSSHPLYGRLTETASRHAEAGLRHVVSGRFNGEHWLPTYAIYLLSSGTAS